MYKRTETRPIMVRDVQIGGQNKVPKLSNNRKYVDSILEYVSKKS